MKSVKRLLALSSALVLVLVSITLFTAEPARADKAASVKVVNGPAEAVPVTVGNANLPVTIANASVPVTLGGATVPVSYSNTRTTPLFVDPGSTARAAVGDQCSIAIYNGEDHCVLADVPEGKILVIETLSCGATVVAGTSPAMRLTTPIPNMDRSGFVNLNHTIALTLSGHVGSNDYYRLTTPVRMYASGGFSVSVGVSAADGSHSASCAFSGHLVTE